MNAILHELRYALRALAARPAFSTLVIGVLAAGLSCVIFMLAMVDGLILRPLPFRAPEELLLAGFSGDGGTGDVFPVADRDMLELRRQAGGIAEIAGVARSTINLSDFDRPERYNGGYASANLFSVLGVAPLLGRDFAAADEVPVAPKVVMLSYDLWQSRYGGDASIVGRSVRVDAQPATVIGVMPKDFSYPRRELLWVAARLAPESLSHEYTFWLVLRRHAGVSDTQVASAAETWLADAARANPDRLRTRSMRVEPLAEITLDRATRRMLAPLLGAALLVLLVACANAANLLLTRALGRQHELAVRSALGASRGRLIAHLLAQSLVLTAIATIAALLLARVGLAWQQRVMHESEFALLWLRFELDGTVVALAVGAALITALVTGVLPALRLRPALVGSQLRSGTRGSSAASSVLVRVLVVGEIALSCALLISVGSLVRGIATLEHADLGIDTNHLLTARVLLPKQSYSSAVEQVRLYDTLGARLREDADVIDASIGTALPGTFYNEVRKIAAAGADPEIKLQETTYAAVDDHFLAAFGVPLVAGRFFDGRDLADGERVAVVDRRFVERFGDGGPMIGRRFHLGARDPGGVTVTIIGVVGRVNLSTPGDEPWPTLLAPLRQSPYKAATIAVRTRGDAQAFMPRLSEIMRGVDADVPLYWVRDYAGVIASMSSDNRVVAQRFGALGAIALVLAAASLYGLTAFIVGQRTREIGVRRALGAPASTLLRNLFTRTGAQVGIGLAIGLVGGLLSARWLTTSMLDMPPSTFGDAAPALIVLGLSALLAVIAPALRALRVDPITALRHE
jgi:predicted permease